MSTKGSRKALRILVYGPQGSGKGTQAEFLARRFRLPVLSAGEVMRQEIRLGTSLGRTLKQRLDQGRYATNAMTNAILAPHLRRFAAGRGYVMDGYPRKIGQLTFLDQLAPPSVVINLKLPLAAVQSRLAARRVCPRGHVYHLTAKPPRRAGRCDVDGLPLSQRHDETPTAIRKRLAEHQKFTLPVIARFRRRGLVIDVDGQPSIPRVSRAILSALRARRLR